jgi:hypothetical protein
MGLAESGTAWRREYGIEAAMTGDQGHPILYRPWYLAPPDPQNYSLCCQYSRFKSSLPLYAINTVVSKVLSLSLLLSHFALCNNVLSEHHTIYLLSSSPITATPPLYRLLSSTLSSVTSPSPKRTHAAHARQHRTAPRAQSVCGSRLERGGDIHTARRGGRGWRGARGDRCYRRALRCR